MNLRKILCALTLLSATVALVACGGGGGDAAPAASQPAATSTLQGRILDGSGAGVANASVSADGTSTLSLADGSFLLSTPGNASTTIILVKKSGFGSNAKEAPSVKGVTTQIDIKLFADQVSTSFNAAAGVSLAPNGAGVVIAENSIQTAAGAAYTGTVSVSASYNSPETVQGVQAFAEPYAGTNAGTAVLLQSVGVIEVKLSDTAGNPLQLKAGSPATLTYPANSVSAGATSIPLWYYDESLKTWVREGTATLQTNGTYQGSVSHFSFWNLDNFTPPGSKVMGCFRDAAGQPVSNQNVVIQGTGWLTHGVGVGDASGNFEATVFSGIPLELKPWASSITFATLPIAALAAGEVRQLPCVTVTNAPVSGAPIVVPVVTTIFTVTTAPANTTVPGTTPVVGTTTAAYAGTYIGTYGGEETGTFNVVVASNGAVTGTTHSDTFNLDFTVTGQVLANGGVKLTTSGNVGSGTFNGSINAAGVVSGTWAYVGLVGSGTFTGTHQ
ncbi:MAG: astroprincin family protein [Polaromonas sp.]